MSALNVLEKYMLSYVVNVIETYMGIKDSVNKFVAWYNFEGKFHSRMHASCLYYNDSLEIVTQQWHKNGLKNRIKKPAEIDQYTNGRKCVSWYREGVHFNVEDLFCDIIYDINGNIEQVWQARAPWHRIALTRLTLIDYVGKISNQYL